MVTENKIEELDNLPSRERVKKSNPWRWRNGLYHKVGDHWPYEIINRLLNNNIGKSFDSTFSYYCKQVPKYQQHIFLEEFFKKHIYSILNYYIDDNGNIQKYDYKKKKIIKFNLIPDIIGFDYYSKYDHKIVRVYERPNYWVDFKLVVEKDNAIYFESKKDPRYQRFIQEKIKADRKKNKIPKKFLTDQDFRNLLKQRDLKEKEENLIKIISHGFDPLTSFRKRKKNDD